MEKVKLYINKPRKKKKKKEMKIPKKYLVRGDISIKNIANSFNL